MRFKILQKGLKCHTKTVTCVVWNASDEIFSCGDDHQLVSWKFDGGMLASKVVAELPDDFYPTDMQCHSRPVQPGSGALKKLSQDVLLITTDDGRYHLVSKTGKIEKSVSAHAGATICGKWSYDGTALLTAGEDGLLKVWSRSGMLRSTVVRGNQPVLAAAWSPDNSMILYAQGPFLLIQSLTSTSKPLKWQGHDGLIMAVSWNQFHGLIVSGGEDCRYKLWDPSGNLLYTSMGGDHPVTSVSWCFSGSHFAVGSFNTLKLCDKVGWSHSTEKLQAGSIYSIAWSNDGTQVVLACSNGSILVAHTIQKKLEYKNYEATLIKRKAIRIQELGTDIDETLDIGDRVVQMEFGFEHLVAVTPSQCHVYSVKNWNTPIIFELKNGSVSAVVLSNKHFLLIEWSAITLYNYQGRQVGVPKWKGQTMEPLYAPSVSVCSDTIVVRDQSNYKLLHVLEITPKKPITEGQPYTHGQEVLALALNYVGEVADRQLALIDANRDLFLISIRATGFGRVCKIAVMAQNIAWATDANVLAGMLDSSLSVWLCPSCVHYSDRKIIRKTRLDRDNAEYGKHATIVAVQQGQVRVRRGDGALVSGTFYRFFGQLHGHVLRGKWEEAISLCRLVQDNETLWTCMAVMAIDGKQLSVAEEACAAVARYDKVDYIRYIKGIPGEMERLAEMALLAGDLLAAEGILLQNGLVPEAIRINVEMYNWARALKLAIKHKKLLSEVLEARKRYLEALDKKEVNQSFLAVQANIAKAHAAKREAREKEKLEREKAKGGDGDKAETNPPAESGGEKSSRSSRREKSSREEKIIDGERAAAGSKEERVSSGEKTDNKSEKERTTTTKKERAARDKKADASKKPTSNHHDAEPTRRKSVTPED
ncbi:hypothetical protein TKK_0003962 [Trichogramma kaykai]|uniref:Intraflagellar transport protein 80 homolog n=1 Tax=Trichogramma kaykai TaxID=54128 RepID=A0ABD2XPB7_9HYME